MRLSNCLAAAGQDLAEEDEQDGDLNSDSDDEQSDVGNASADHE